ncbi:MAG: hypothetical protein IH840_12310, partial [Candidatus Heimdallarchaeota archaeon]|nr:hypothetical protein [Candidatus Heimdallarchaeota archaeon]
MNQEDPKTRLLHVQGQELVAIKLGENLELLDGDVYVFDEGNMLWIWVGKDSSVDEHMIAAWLVHKIDPEARYGAPEVKTVNQDQEPEEFLAKFKFTVVVGDTPGFLRKAELDMVEYKLYHIYIEENTIAFDDAIIEEVEISRDSLDSDDVYVLDGNEAIYCWIGKTSQIEERRMGQKVMQKIDAERHYLPLQYTINEGEGGKSEQAFYDFLE